MKIKTDEYICKIYEDLEVLRYKLYRLKNMDAEIDVAEDCPKMDYHLMVVQDWLAKIG